MANTIFIIIVCFLVFDYIFERILDYLNSTYWSDELPDELNEEIAERITNLPEVSVCHVSIHTTNVLVF